MTTPAEYQRERRALLRKRGYRGVMVYLTPSADDALSRLKEHYNEMNTTDILCALLKCEYDAVRSGRGSL